MNLFPRLRQSCQRDQDVPAADPHAGTRIGQGPSATSAVDALCGNPPRRGAAAQPGHYEPEFEVNHAVFSGLIVADPQRDKSREGDPITVLLISFPAPDERVHWGSACCEVEVLDEIADEHRDKLRVGAPILVSGELTGAGGIWAKFISPGEPT